MRKQILISTVFSPFAIFDFSIHVDLKSSVYCNSVYHGDEEEWDFGWDRYQSSNVATEKDNLLGALGCSKELWILNRFLFI